MALIKAAVKDTTGLCLFPSCSGAVVSSSCSWSLFRPITSYCLKSWNKTLCGSSNKRIVCAIFVKHFWCLYIYLNVLNQYCSQCWSPWVVLEFVTTAGGNKSILKLYECPQMNERLVFHLERKPESPLFLKCLCVTPDCDCSITLYNEVHCLCGEEKVWAFCFDHVGKSYIWHGGKLALPIVGGELFLLYRLPNMLVFVRSGLCAVSLSGLILFGCSHGGVIDWTTIIFRQPSQFFFCFSALLSTQ